MVTGLKNLGSKQKAAWKSILAYISEHGNDATFTLSDVDGGKTTLDALVDRELISAKRSYEGGFYYTHYSVNPRYIPYTHYSVNPRYIPAASEPQPAPVAAQETSEPKFKVGDRVVVTDENDYHTGETGEIIEIVGEDYRIEFLRNGSHNAMWYVAGEFIPADGTPATGERAVLKVGDEVYVKPAYIKRIIGVVDPDGGYGLRTMSGGCGFTRYDADMLVSVADADRETYEQIILTAAESHKALEARIAELEAALTTLYVTLDRVATQKGELEEQSKDLQARVWELEAENAGLKAQATSTYQEYAYWRRND